MTTVDLRRCVFALARLSALLVVSAASTVSALSAAENQNMSPLIYVLMCLADGSGSLDLTADERFWRDEQSCAIVRNNLLKECACVTFVPGSNSSAGATVTVLTHQAPPVVPREKIEDKPKPAAEKAPRRRQQVPVEPQRYQGDRGFGGFGWGSRGDNSFQQ
jgi:hypothetical protein